MLFYRAAVDLSRSTLNYVAGLIRRRRKAIGSKRRLHEKGSVVRGVALSAGDARSVVGCVRFGVAISCPNSGCVR
ncbi:hypothetical protein [Actinomadura roseirufa]|uniref:hypothetical protein n=1 Tax=Actinomadura roseirufa TaxID=2094049 RepID=UPI0010412DBE